MSDELEPYIPEIEPTAVYGPDDWRPYSDGIDHERAAAYIVSGLDDALARYRAQAQEDYAAARRYADGAESFTDGFPDDGRYEPTDPEKEAAVRAIQNHMRTRGYALSMGLMDPKAAFRITGSGA